MSRRSSPTTTVSWCPDSTDLPFIVPEQKPLTKRNLWNFLAVAVIAIAWSSCDDSSNVGGGLIADRNIVTTDTFVVPTIDKLSLNPYTGEPTHLSTGSYNDPWFGPIKAEAFLIPNLVPKGLVDTLSDSTRVVLNIRTSSFYGDTINATRFGIYGVRGNWRPSTFRANTQPATDTQPFATFEVTRDSLVQVEMPQTWLEEYKQFVYSDAANPDSAYVRNYFGLAIKPLSEGKIISMLKDSVQMTIYNPRDTNIVYVRASAHNFERSAPASFPSGVHVSSNMENLPSITIRLDLAKLSGSNITRAVLQIQEDETYLAATLPQGHVRPRSLTLNAYSPNGLLAPEDVIVLVPSITFIRQDNNIYQAVVTNLIRSMLLAGESERTYYLSAQPRSGIFHNTMMDKGLLRQPRLLLTIVKREGL